MRPGILEGLRIIEVSAFVAAPIAGGTLASLGADVIRVEQCGGGIDAQRWPLHNGRSLYRSGLDRGKRSVTIDLSSPRGQELVGDLLEASGSNGGILISNVGSGWLSFDQLIQRRQDLIMVTLTGRPDGGTAVDYTVNAGTGFAWITGPADAEGPINNTLPAWDVAAGLLMTIGVLSAERHRRLTGMGQHVTLALSDVALVVANHLGLLEEAALVPEPRPRLGNAIFGTYGSDFQTNDNRHVMITALTPRQWRSLVDATETASAFEALEEAHGVSLKDEGARYELRREISALLAPWFAQRTLAEVEDTLDRSGVLWGTYRTFKQLLAEDPQAALPPASALRFSETPPPILSAPRLGEHTESVLGSIPGMTEADVAALKAAGVIE